MLRYSGSSPQLPWRGGRVVECTAFEKRQGRKLLGSSNLPLSAKALSKANMLCVRGVTRLRASRGRFEKAEPIFEELCSEKM